MGKVVCQEKVRPNIAASAHCALAPSGRLMHNANAGPWTLRGALAVWLGPQHSPLTPPRYPNKNPPPLPPPVSRVPRFLLSVATLRCPLHARASCGVVAHPVAMRTTLDVYSPIFAFAFFRGRCFVRSRLPLRGVVWSALSWARCCGAGEVERDAGGSSAPVSEVLVSSVSVPLRPRSRAESALDARWCERVGDGVEVRTESPPSELAAESCAVLVPAALLSEGCLSSANARVCVSVCL